MSTENTTDAEIQAGAEALASMYFLNGDQWPWSRFGENQQNQFRNKARAAIEAAKKAGSAISHG